MLGSHVNGNVYLTVLYFYKFFFRSTAPFLLLFSVSACYDFIYILYPNETLKTMCLTDSLTIDRENAVLDLRYLVNI